jgi:hypothetical protein
MRAGIVIFTLPVRADGSGSIRERCVGRCTTGEERARKEIFHALSCEFPLIRNWVEYAHEIDPGVFDELGRGDGVRQITFIRMCVQKALSFPGCKAIAFIHPQDELGEHPRHSPIQRTCSLASNSIFMLNDVGISFDVPMSCMHDGCFSMWWDSSSDRSGWTDLELAPRRLPDMTRLAGAQELLQYFPEMKRLN